MAKPTTQKQKSKRVQMELRRFKALDLKVKGFSDRAIARELGVGVATAHGDVKKVLENLARKHIDEAANLRALLNLRYESLFLAYYDQAIAGDREAAKMVMGVMDRVAKINGVIPDKSLITVDQRAMKFDEPVTFQINPDFVGIDELAKKAYDERI
ncbi:hypothetical protein M1N56_06430 [Dehalococcoidia bacterium]|nr:hypothetical protein [Dehalococcoidia bacterium]